MTYHPEKKAISLRRIIAGGVLIESCLGVVWAFPVFTAKLLEKTGRHNFTAEQVNWIFSIAIIAFAVAVILSGKLIDRIGSKRLVLVSGLILSFGYLMGGLFGSSFAVQLIFVGITGGAGAGLAYLVPLVLAMRWFPDIKGLAAGLVFAGFGFGVVLWAELATYWFGFDIMGLGGVQSVYLLFGSLILAAVLAGWILIGDAMTDVSEGWQPTQPTGRFAAIADLRLDGLPGTGRFYVVFAAFLLSALAGIMFLGHIQPYGIEALRAKGLEIKIAVKVAALAAFLFQVAAVAGSAVWGAVSDRIEAGKAVALMCLFLGSSAVLMYYTGGSPQSVILFSCLAGFSFGGNFTLFPILTASQFDEKKTAANYSFVFTAYVTACIAGPTILEYLKGSSKGAAPQSVWMSPLIISGIASLIAALSALVLERKTRRA